MNQKKKKNQKKTKKQKQKTKTKGSHEASLHVAMILTTAS